MSFCGPGLRIVRDVYESLTPGACLFLVEKILGVSCPLDELMVHHYYAIKQGHGYSREEIQRKRLSLEGILVSKNQYGCPFAIFYGQYGCVSRP